MTKRVTVEDRLDELGLELSATGSCLERVMAEARMLHVAPDQTAIPSRRWITRAASFVTAAILLISFGLWSVYPASLQAKALAALARAKSIHMTGVVSHVVRKWPVEDPDTELKKDSYQVAAWYWDSADGTPRSHEQQGPVIATRNGSSYSEFQTDVDLMYTYESTPKDRIGRIDAIEAALRSLGENNTLLKELEAREEDGRQLRGLSFTREQSSEEYWFDSKSDQLVRLVRRSKEKGTVECDLSFRYDLPVPDAISSYQHPVAKTIRTGSTDEWSEYVRTLPTRLPAEANQITILPRTKPQSFRRQYARVTDDGKFLVVPLDYKPGVALDIDSFLRLSVCATPLGIEKPSDLPQFEYWRLEKGLADLTFVRSDVICEKDTPWQDWVRAALATLELEYQTIQEDRIYWIAEYDGRPLKPWREVNPPVAGVLGERIPGAGVGFNGAAIDDLFAGFNSDQNDGLTATLPIIENRTGIPEPPDWDRQQHPKYEDYRKAVDYESFLVASDVPWFPGIESHGMTKEWFETQFGITFREETRPKTIHLIKRKEAEPQPSDEESGAAKPAVTADADEVPLLPKSIEYGEVHEVTLWQDEPGLGNFLVDLDNNKLFDEKVFDVDDVPHSERFIKIREQCMALGIDAYCEVGKSFAGLMGIDMVGLPVREGDWDADYFTMEQLPQTTIGYPCPIAASRDLPATWIFRTRKNYGVLQILEIIDDPEKPCRDGAGIKFRYKLVKQPS